MKSLTARAICLLVVAIGACTRDSGERAADVRPAASAQEKIFETNVTNDLNLSSGEPEIAVDPTNPSRLAVVEFALGSAKVPASSYWNPRPLPNHNLDPEWFNAATIHAGRVMISTDGGNTWHQSGLPPAYDPSVTPQHGFGDPMIAIGPDGTIYTASEIPPTLRTPPPKMTNITPWLRLRVTGERLGAGRNPPAPP